MMFFSIFPIVFAILIMYGFGVYYIMKKPESEFIVVDLSLNEVSYDSEIAFVYYDIHQDQFILCGFGRCKIDRYSDRYEYMGML